MNAKRLSRWRLVLSVLATPLALATELPVVGIVAIGTNPSPKIERWATFYKWPINADPSRLIPIRHGQSSIALKPVNTSDG